MRRLSTSMTISPGWCRLTRLADMARLACASTLLFILGACGGGNPAPILNPSPGGAVAPGTWVVLGSSSAEGVGATAGQGWVARLADARAAQQVQVLNLARGGSTTYAALPTASVPPAGRPVPDPARNLDRALAAGPRLLLLAFPTNDTAAGYAVDETVGNLTVVRQAAAAAGVPTLVLGTQPRNAFTSVQREQLRQIDEALARRLGPCFVPLFPSLADASDRIHPDLSAGDGIHLNDAGHAVVVGKVQAALDGGRCVQVTAR